MKKQRREGAMTLGEKIGFGFGLSAKIWRQALFTARF